MKINLRYKETGTEIIIETQHNDPDDPVKLDFRAKNQEEQLIVDALKNNTLKIEIESQYGHYGHGIELNSTTNLDLAIAVRSLPSFELISIDPRIMPSPLPEGVQS